MKGKYKLYKNMMHIKTKSLGQQQELRVEKLLQEK